MRSRTRSPRTAVLLTLTVALTSGARADSQSALDPAGPAAERIADLWWAILAACTLVTVLVLALLLVGLWRGIRQQGAQTLDARRSRWLVIAGGVILPLSVAIPFAASSFSIGRAIDAPSPADALTVEVIGRLWWWEMHYLDSSGQRIATTANEIHIPTGRPVRFLLKSDNVIHSFWVPQLAGKVDLIPGRENALTLQAERPGIYRGQCAEYCGTQHALMAFLVVAQPPAAFDTWLARQRAPAPEPATPVAALGRDIFLNAGCGECHTVRGTPADGDLGPDLTHLAGRRTLAAATIPNRVGHLGGWITDPQRIKPGALMPPTELPPDALKALLRYLEGLE